MHNFKSNFNKIFQTIKSLNISCFDEYGNVRKPAHFPFTFFKKSVPSISVNLWSDITSVKSSMDYPPQALFFLLLTALKNIHVAMAMLIFLCLARNKNYFGLTETPHLT